MTLVLLVLSVIVLTGSPCSYAAGFSLQGANLQRVGNVGPVSLIMSGSGFTANTVFELIDSGGRHFAATKKIFMNEAKMLVTFNLLGAATGSAQISAVDGTNSAQKLNALSIATGVGGKLNIQLQSQESFQPGKPGLIQVNYANTGDTDIDIPLLVLSVPDATTLTTSQGSSNFGSSAMILGLPNAPLNTSLRPQEQVTIPFSATMTNPGVGMATITALDPRSPAFGPIPLNYSGAISSLPDPTSPFVPGIISDLKSQYGDTMGSFYSAELNKLQEIVNLGVDVNETVQNINGEWRFQGATPQPGVVRLPVFDRDETLSIPVTDGTPVANSGDGIKKTYAVLIGINDYEAADADLNATIKDVNNIYKYLFHELRVPDRQITRVMGDFGSPKVTKDMVRDAILNSGADGDDNLVIYYSGHGTLRKSGDSGQTVGAWCMSDADSTSGNGFLTGTEISALISKKNAGQTYLFSDSCHSGALIKDIKAVRTAIFAASTAEGVSNEKSDSGGYFSAVLLHYLRKGMSLGEAIGKAVTVTGFTANQTPEYYPDGVDMVYPFGAMGTKAQYHSANLDNNLYWITKILEIGEGAYKPPAELLTQWNKEATDLGLSGINNFIYVCDKTAEWTVQQGFSSDLEPGSLTVTALNVTALPVTLPSDFVPGGLAVSLTRRIFYLSDNTNGRILMLSPIESKHRKIPLLSGLVKAGGLKLSDNGRSLVYTTNNLVKKLYFGFTAFIGDTLGQPLSGAVVTMKSDLGERTIQVPADGYLTVMDLQKPSLTDRSVSLTVRYQGTTQLLPFTLLDRDHTFVSFTYSGNPGVIPEPVYPVGAAPY